MSRSRDLSVWHVRAGGPIMPEQRDGHLPVRSRVAVAFLKGGLVLGAVWALALVAFMARAAFAFI